VKSEIANLSEINRQINSPQSAESLINDWSFEPKIGARTGSQLNETAGRDFVVVGPLLFLEDATDDGSFAVGSPQIPIPVDSMKSRDTLEFSLENKNDDEQEDGPRFSVPNPKYAPPDFNLVAAHSGLDEWLDIFETKEEELDSSEQVTDLEITQRPNAFIRIAKVSHLRGVQLSQIQLKWETDENSWTGSENVKVHIFRGPSQQGPWTPIATAQENTGSYSWTVSQEDRNPFYIFLQCEGEIETNHRELVSDFTMHPIQLPAALFNRG